MIHIKRGKAPNALSSPKVKAEIKAMSDFYLRPHEERAQHRYPFKLVPSREERVREALAMMFHRKCAYCETYMSSESGEIENFRPKAGAVGTDGSFSPDHYWWLTFEWDNLLIACGQCNRSKANRFPVKNPRAAPGTRGKKLRTEEPLLLDPCDEEVYPEHLLVFDALGTVASNDERGRVTIECLKLNRPSLVEARRKALNETLDLFQLTTSLKTKGFRPSAESLQVAFRILAGEVFDPQREYLAIKRQFLQQAALALAQENPVLADLLTPFIALRTSLTEIAPTTPLKSRKAAARKTVRKFKSEQKKRDKYSVESTSKVGLEEYYLKRQIIERIEISNFKAIHHLDLKFPPTHETEKCSWLLLLGENAVGKTSVLEAVALALSGERERSELRLKPPKFLRRGATSGYIRVFFTDSEQPVEVTFGKRSRVFKAKPPEQKRPKVISAAYGVTRLLPGKGVLSQPSYKASKPHNLFNQLVPLLDADVWLHSLDHKQRRQPAQPGGDQFSEFELIARDVNALLLLKGKDRLYKGDDGKIRVRLFGHETELSELSMGYQSVVALATDIMSVMHFRWKSMEVAEGIVLIDELDSHLHPRWKMMIVKRLRQVFPNVQFLVTSHDPLLLRGLHKGEVVVMRRDTKNRPFALTDLPAPDAMRAEQILTSEFFGLSSTMDPEVEERFDEYYELLAAVSPTAKQKTRIAELKKELKGLRQLGTTRREQLMLEAADEFLAKRDRGQDNDGGRLKASTRRKIAAIWSGRRAGR